MRLFTTMRRFSSIACTIVAVAITPPAVADETAAAKKIDVVPQQLSSALQDFSEQSGLQVAYVATLADNVSSKGTHDAGTAEAALSEILDSTGLEYQFVNADTVAIGPVLAANNEAADPENAQTAPSRMVLMAQASQTRQGQPSSTTSRANSSSQSESRSFSIEEILVTAQKREQAVQDVPISMSVLNGDDLENAGIENITQLTYSVPGLSSVELGPGFQNLTIRGIGNLRGTASLVGLYLDEAAVAGASEQQIDLRVFDLARVEVLRGPQGTLYGEGSMGGTIRYITNDPDLDDFTGNLEVSAFDTHKGGMSESVKGVANLPLVDGKFGIRIAASYEDTAGWIDQPTANREDINNSDLTNVRVKSLWQINEAFTAKATVIVHRNEGDGYNYVNTGRNEDSLYVPALNPTVVTPYQDDYEHYGLTLDYDFGFASLISATSYTDMKKFTLQSFRLNFLPVGTPTQGFNEFTNQNIDFLTQELRLTSSDASKLKWTLGAFYRDADNSNVADFNFEGFLFSGDTLESSESVAVFGDAEYALKDRVTIGAGGRYFEDRRSLTDYLAGTKVAETFSSFSPRGYISFAATENINAYASVSKGFRSGGFNDGAAIAAGAPVGFEPEELWSYELGTKMELLNGRVGADLAVFYSDYQDYVSSGLVPGGDLIEVQTFNAGTVEVRGVEWAFVWKALDNLRLGINGSVVDAEITEITAINPQAIVGDEPDNTPGHGYSVFLDSSFKWTPNIAGFLRVNYNVQGKMFFHSRNEGLVTSIDNSDEVEFLDVHIGGQWDRWTAELFASNLLDEAGFVTAYTSFGAGAQARPRSIGVKVGVEFD